MGKLRIAFVWLILWYVPASADTILVVSASSNSDVDASAVEYVIRSHLLSDRHTTPIPQLPKGKKNLPALIKQNQADYAIVVIANRRGYNVDVALRLVDKTGQDVQRVEKSGLVVDLPNVATASLAELTKVSGRKHVPPKVSQGDIEPLARSLAAYTSGQHQEASKHLLAVRPSVARKLQFTRTLASGVASQDSLGSKDRLTSAVLSRRPKFIIELADKQLKNSPKDAEALAAKANALIMMRELSRAEKVLKKAPDVPATQLARAQLLAAKGKPKDAAILLKQPLQQGYQPAMSFVSDLSDDNAFSAIASDVSIVLKNPKLGDSNVRSVLAARAIRTGDLSPETIKTINPLDLVEEDRSYLSHALKGKVSKRELEATILDATIRAAAGDAEALRAVDEAVIFHKDDPRLASLRETIRAGESKAVFSKDVETKATKNGLVKKPVGLAAELQAKLTDADAGLRAPPYGLGDRALGRVVVAKFGDTGPGIFSPYETKPQRLASALQSAIATAPHVVKVEIGKDTIPSNWQTAIGKMDQMSRGTPTDLFVLYQLTNDGDKPMVKLFGYRPGFKNPDGSSPYRIVPEFSPNAGEDLVGSNPIFWGAIFLVGGALVLFLGYRFIRGSGNVLVSLETDPTAENEAISILVTRNPKRPHIADAQAHAKRLHSQGIQRRKRQVLLARNRTTIKGVPSGKWYVHVVGSYRKGQDWRTIDDSFSEQVRVKRNQDTSIKFDLVPKHSEHHIQVFSTKGPQDGALIWLESNANRRYTTDVTGSVEIDVPFGSQALIVQDKDGFIVRKRVFVEDANVRHLTINLAREKRMAELESGVDLGPDQWQGREDPASQRLAVGSEVTPEDHVAMPPPAMSNKPNESLEAFASTQHSMVPTPEPVALSLGGGGNVAAPLPTPETSSQAGLSRYVRSKELGRGAMGVVFQAFDNVLERDVALKVITEEIKKYPQLVEAFQTEAKTLAALNHPNIVTVFDQGQDGNEMFLIMELIEGETLEDTLARDTIMPVQDVAELSQQLCKGLAYAHKKRVIHRDIKPGNIFISEDRIPKLGDFGLAKVLNELQIRQTTVKGTPLYMPPEQIRGTDIDFRADIYAFGCTLYEMLCGRPPFIEGEILYHHLHTEPEPPSVHNPALSEKIDKVILKAIAKSPSHRYMTADKLGDALMKAAS